MTQTEKDIKEIAIKVAALISAEEFQEAAKMTEDVPLSLRTSVFYAAGERTDLNKWLEYSTHCLEESCRRDEESRK